jgi:hypothetical protein
MSDHGNVCLDVKPPPADNDTHQHGEQTNQHHI